MIFGGYHSVFGFYIDRITVYIRFFFRIFGYPHKPHKVCGFSMELPHSIWKGFTPPLLFEFRLNSTFFRLAEAQKLKTSQVATFYVQKLREIFSHNKPKKRSFASHDIAKECVMK